MVLEKRRARENVVVPKNTKLSKFIMIFTRYNTRPFYLKGTTHVPSYLALFLILNFSE